MYRIVLLGLLCLAGCRSNPPPPPNSAVNVSAPGVRVNVQDDGSVSVRHPAGTVNAP